MSRKRFTMEQIINKLMEVEIEVGQGQTVQEAVRKIGVNDNTYYKRRKLYGTMHMDQTRRLKDLEKENARLKKVAADLAVDNAVLKDAALGK
jgi:ACT domain-containing protein